MNIDWVTVIWESGGGGWRSGRSLVGSVLAEHLMFGRCDFFLGDDFFAFCLEKVFFNVFNANQSESVEGCMNVKLSSKVDMRLTFLYSSSNRSSNSYGCCCMRSRRRDCKKRECVFFENRVIF